MRVYLAGPYSHRHVLARFATDLGAVGFEVTSRWLTGAHDPTPGTDPANGASLDDRIRWATEDLEDIDRADVLVSFSRTFLGCQPGQGLSGGRHAEVGYAIAQGIPVIHVGPEENVFHALAHREATWALALAWLAGHFDQHAESTS